MAKRRGNSLTGAAWKGNTSDKSVKVLAHMRDKPVRKPAGKPSTTALQDVDQNAENAAHHPGLEDRGVMGGLLGVPAVNHMKAAIGLLNRKRA